MKILKCRFKLKNHGKIKKKRKENEKLNYDLIKMTSCITSKSNFNLIIFFTKSIVVINT